MFRRLVILVELPDGARAGIAAARALARRPDHVHIIGLTPVSLFMKLHPDPWPRLTKQLADADASLRELAAELSDWSPAITTEPALDAIEEDIRISVATAEAELIVIGPLASRNALEEVELVANLTTVCARPVAVVGRGYDAPESPITRAACLFDGQPVTAAALAAFWRDRIRDDGELGFLALLPVKGMAPEDVAADREVSGLRARVRFGQIDVPLAQVTDELGVRFADWRTQLVCALIDADWQLTHLLGGVLVAYAIRELAVPIMLIPASGRDLPVYVDRERLVAADLLRPRAGGLRVAIERAGVLGMASRLDGAPVGLVRRGEMIARSDAVKGFVNFDVAPAPVGDEFLGLGRVGPDGPRDAVAALETKVCVVDPAGRDLILFDGAIETEAMAALRAKLAGAPGRLCAAVRLSEGTRLEAVKERMIEAGFDAPRILDAGQVLGNGMQQDVPAGTEALTLARCARRLRGEGVNVIAVVHQGASAPDAGGFAVISAWRVFGVTAEELEDDLKGASSQTSAPSNADDQLGARLDALGAPLRTGQRVDIQFDNAKARRGAVALIDAATERVHLQAYIVRDEDTAREFEAALVRAAGRGVRVRLLVDSLYSIHETLGIKNALLARLEKTEGVRVLASRPIEGVPSLEDLKQRDHRKLLVADGCAGLVTGRNLADTYYRGFDEIALTRETPGAALPWLDAGVAVTGPIVADVDTCFREAWLAAGGDDFDVRPCEPAGDTAARLVVHRGLRDANTLDAYLAMIESARTQITIVNTFPMQFEILEALKAALRRGVRVRVLVGNVRPRFGDTEYFPGGAVRELATQVIHGRIDALVEAGAEAYEFALAPLPTWSPDLGIVRPHVHGKVMTADDTTCAVGSANLDITAGYWESEAILVIQSPAVTARLNALLDDLTTHSKRLDRDDPAWRDRAQQRAWLSKNWPSIIG